MEKNCTTIRLNPYSNGIRIEFNNNLINFKYGKSVLILILMEYG